MKSLSENTRQVFIVNQDSSGTKFALWIDLPSSRSYTMRKFFDYYTRDFFGEWSVMHYTLITHEPQRAEIIFHDTTKGRELATMFKLGHECL